MGLTKTTELSYDWTYEARNFEGPTVAQGTSSASCQRRSHLSRVLVGLAIIPQLWLQNLLFFFLLVLFCFVYVFFPGMKRFSVLAI